MNSALQLFKNKKARPAMCEPGFFERRITSSKQVLVQVLELVR